MGVSQGSSTAMVRLTILLCIFIQLTVGLQIEDGLKDKLEKVLEDTIQNTELDGDIVDFPAWSSSGDDMAEKTDEDSKEVKVGVQDKNEKPGSVRITDLIEKYLTNHFNKPIEKNSNRWNFWKDFVLPHSSQKDIWSENFGLHTQFHSQPWGWGNHWSSLRDIFQPTPPPPQNNWWSKIFSSNSRIDSPDSSDSMFTIYHKLTVDNKTREGVAKVPSSQVLPFMRTVWNSLSSDSHMALGFGALLPVLGLMLPVMIFATIIPIIVLVMVSVFGFMSGALVLLPLLLTGLIGEGALPVDRMIEELFLEEFDGAATLEQIFNTDFEEITEKLDNEDSTDKAVDKIEEIPRYLRF